MVTQNEHHNDLLSTRDALGLVPTDTALPREALDSYTLHSAQFDL